MKTLTILYITGEMFIEQVAAGTAQKVAEWYTTHPYVASVTVE